MATNVNVEKVHDAKGGESFRFDVVTDGAVVKSGDGFKSQEAAEEAGLDAANDSDDGSDAPPPKKAAARKPVKS